MAKAKGTTLLSLVKLLRQNRARARAVLAPELHHYFERRIQPSAWYPEEDLLALIRCMLELVPGQRAAALQEMGRNVASEHMEGVYGHLRPDEGNLASLGRRSFALWSSQHDSGRLTVVHEGPGAIRFDLTDFALTSRELCDITGAYLRETLRLAGIDPGPVEHTCRLDGSAACLWRVTWNEA